MTIRGVMITVMIVTNFTVMLSMGLCAISDSTITPISSLSSPYCVSPWTPERIVVAIEFFAIFAIVKIMFPCAAIDFAFVT